MRNKYPGNCGICNKHVGVGQGYFEIIKKRWFLRCKKCVGKDEMGEERVKLDREKKWACDYFARCLLMPEKAFIKIYKKYKGNYDLIASKFAVQKCRVGERVLDLKLDKKYKYA